MYLYYILVFLTLPQCIISQYFLYFHSGVGLQIANTSSRVGNTSLPYLNWRREPSLNNFQTHKVISIAAGRFNSFTINTPASNSVLISTNTIEKQKFFLYHSKTLYFYQVQKVIFITTTCQTLLVCNNRYSRLSWKRTRNSN